MIYYSEEEYNIFLFVGGSRGKEERHVFMPNEIFTDLKNAIDVWEEGRSSKHIAFAFGYVFLTYYLYNYALFGREGNGYGEIQFTEAELKKLLTVSPTSKGKKGITYITKKNGVLEQAGYIKKVTDYPISYYFNKDDMILNFNYYSEIKEILPIELQKVRNRKINYPVKLLDNRVMKLTDGNEYETFGTLDDIGNTTKVDVKVFVYCMTREDLGVEAFYLYCILLYKGYLFGKGSWDCPLEEMPSNTGMKIDIISGKLKALEQYNMIYNSHMPFVPNLRDYTSKKIYANTYRAKPYDEFIGRGVLKKEIEVRRVLSAATYEATIGFVDDLNATNEPEADERIEEDDFNPFAESRVLEREAINMPQ
ncbi:hypothetical protein [Domibacillus tundrae]|uniref:hypothetical protein n=1 Tax=Domibacillus tundrae TaxID=1587527 RepID=UPI000617D7A4|nr:hypothetical protein [Domibacillus tundrae]